MEKQTDNIKKFRKYILENNFEEALHITNNLLDIKRNNVDFIYAKYVCLVELDQFDEALNFIKANAKFCNMNFEKAYCLYRLDKCLDAKNTLGKIANHGSKEKELLAQIDYKMGKYLNSSDIYQNLIRTTQDDFEEERICNLLASLSHEVSNAEQIKDFENNLNQSTHETYFNMAFIQASLKMWDKSLYFLKLAEESCKKFYKGEENEELEQELSNIKLITAFIYQLKGQGDLAISIYKENIKYQETSPNLLLCINNQFCLDEVYQQDYKKVMKKLTDSALISKLAEDQKKQLYINYITTCLNNNQIDVAKNMIKTFETNFSEDKFTKWILELALAMRDKKKASYQNLLEQLKTLPEASPNSELELFCKFCMMQIDIQQGKFEQAATFIETLPGYYQYPQLVQYLIYLRNKSELRESNNLRSGATSPVKNVKGLPLSSNRSSPTFAKKNILNKNLETYIAAIDYLQNQENKEPLILCYVNEIIKILRKPAIAKMQPNDKEESIDFNKLDNILNHLIETYPNSVEYKKIYLNLLQYTNIEKATQIATQYLAEKSTTATRQTSLPDVVDEKDINSTLALTFNVSHKYKAKKQNRTKLGSNDKTIKSPTTDGIANDVLVDTRKKGTAHLRFNANCLRRRRIRQKAKRILNIRSKLFKDANLDKSGATGNDPERWLPKHLRTNNKGGTSNQATNKRFKRKGQKSSSKKDEISRGTQGSTLMQEEGMDTTNNIKIQSSVNINQPPLVNAPQASSGMSKVQMKKKKKKSKW